MASEIAALKHDNEQYIQRDTSRLKEIELLYDNDTSRLARCLRMGEEIAALRQRLEWQPMQTAPKTGPVKEVLLRVIRAGTEGVLICHWAYGGGEEQPRFGPAWFFWTGYDFRELKEAPFAWMPLPALAVEPPAGQKP